MLATESFAAIRFQQPGGLSCMDIQFIGTAVMETPGLCGWTISNYNPDLDPRRKGADRIVSFLETMVKIHRGEGTRNAGA